MNVLIFEYITGGGLVDVELPTSLVKEGELMLNAVASDFEELPDIQVSVLRDYRLYIGHSDNEHKVSLENNFTETISSLENTMDALLIIAPESDGILSALCEAYENSDFILLNSTARSTTLLSDKLETFLFLQSFNIPQVPSYALEGIKSFQEDSRVEFKAGIQSNRVVIKPKDGVGCENVYVVDSLNSVTDIIDLAERDNFIVQPYVEGQAASLSLLCWQGECLLLSANIQTIDETENSFELKGCIVNALKRDDLAEFSKNLIKVLPELRGYIGVDIIITEKEILLVEINPRLTTSYAGLKSALGINPASLILQTFIHKKLPQMDVTSDITINIEVGEDRAA